MNAVSVTQWNGSGPPSEEIVQAALRAEGLRAYAWSNGPGDVYAAHTHPFHKIIYVVRGSILFGLPQSGERLTLRAGDRLELPAGILHEAIVGQEGVLCYEAHLSS